MNGSITLLEHTSQLVKIFTSFVPIQDMRDERIVKLTEILNFFEGWEKEARECKRVTKALMSSQCREDLASTILGFIELCKQHLTVHKTSIIPGRVNSDIVENT